MKKLGADRVIDYHTENWWETLKSGEVKFLIKSRYMDANEVDVIYDTVGQSGTADYAMKILNKNGVNASKLFLVAAHFLITIPIFVVLFFITFSK